MSWLFLITMAGFVLWSAYSLGAWYQRKVDERIIYRAMKDGHLNEADAEAAILFIRYERDWR